MNTAATYDEPGVSFPSSDNRIIRILWFDIINTKGLFAT